MNPNAALQSVVEDLLESFSQTPLAALADIINCILRCCGSNDSVDSDRAVDHDGIVDALDDFTEVLKEASLSYTLRGDRDSDVEFRMTRQHTH
jgi:cohesin complex subunit SA-1/2